MEEGFLQHLWGSAHVVLAHFPIALLSIAFLLTLVGYLGGVLNRFAPKSRLNKLRITRAYDHVWLLQLIGTVFIYPTMLFGERDESLIVSEKLQEIVDQHANIGELTTKYYILSTLVLGWFILQYKHHKGLLGKGSIASKMLDKKRSLMLSHFATKKICQLQAKHFDKKHPIQTFGWLAASLVGFLLLSYTGYLGGELVHEKGILVQ